MADPSGTNPGDLTLETTPTVRQPRRRALWGALAAVAVAAGALAVSAGGGGDDSLPRLPVALGSAAGAESAAGTTAPAADMRMAWITYLAGEDLPALGGEAPAYRLAGAVDEARVRALAEAVGLAGDPVHEDRFWHLRTDDGVLEVYEDGGGSWWYSAESFVVEPATGGGSTGSPGCEPGPAVDCGVIEPAPDTTMPACAGGAACGSASSPTTTGVGCGPEGCGEVATPACEPGTACTLPAEECPPNANCVAPEPEPPLPPADLPDEAEARQIALDLLASTGMDVAGAKVTVDGPHDAWYVMVEPVLDGLPVSGWTAAVAVGSKGAIVNASGTLASPERLGDYPLIDTGAAIDRLNEQQGGWFAYSSGPGGAEDATAACAAEDLGTTTVPADCPAPATTSIAGECKVLEDGSEECTSSGVTCAEVAVTSDGADVAVASDGGVVEEPCPMPMPMPEPEPMEVTLHDAEQVLVLLPAFDGSGDTYLLPGYRFTGDDGHLAEIAAVADESLAPTTTTAVPETAETAPPSPPATDCDVLVEDDGSGTTHTVHPCPGGIEPSQPDLTHLSDGEEPQVGVPYYVDVNTHCGWFTLGSRWWATDAPTPLAWAAPTEGGAFTLTSPDAGTFVGDAEGTKTADFTARGPAAELPVCD